MKKAPWSRRHILKTLVSSLGVPLIPYSSFANEGDNELLHLPIFTEKPEKPVTAIVLGAGNRGTVYGNFAAAYPEQMDFVGVAEPITIRRAFAPYHGRRTRIMGSMGFIEGDMETFTVHDFRTLKSEVVDIRVKDVDGYEKSGHGGGDWHLVADFVKAVSQKNPALLTSTIDQSIESHVACFMAEKSRLEGKIMAIRV